MKKTYISPALAVYSLHAENDMLGLTMSAAPGTPGNTIETDTEWDTSKKQPDFGGFDWEAEADE